MDKKVFTELPKGITKTEAFKIIIENCEIFNTLDSKGLYLEEVIKREAISSTGVGHSLSISHGMIENLPKTIIALGLSREGISFDDKYPIVHLVFLIASNKNSNEDYIKSLSSLLSWLRDDEIRDALLNDEENPKKDSFLRMLSSQDFFRLDAKIVDNY